jgi:hypothetical protein
LQTSKEHIAQQLRTCLPPDKKEASWGYLAAQFPWYGMIHWLRAAEHSQDEILLQKAALFSPDVLRLHTWLHTNGKTAPIESVVEVPQFEDETESDTLVDTLTTSPTKESQEEEIQVFPAELASLNGVEKKDINPIEEISPEETDATNNIENKSISLPGLESLNQQANQELSELKLEPYHSVDYFASQGIKVEKKLPEMEETQFDKQVKSFTDWLKTMKRLKYQPATQYADPLVEAQAKKISGPKRGGYRGNGRSLGKTG